MLFEPEPDLGSQPNRPRTLAISIVIHLLLIGLIIVRPDLFKSLPKRIIRIAGQEYDLDKLQLQELTLAMPQPAPARPPAVEDRPLIQPPAPEPPPVPPQQQPPPPPPNVVISPEDVIADGARPDAQPKPSRGNTEERARAGSGSAEPAPAPAPPPKPEPQAGPPQVAQNTNPNALRAPGSTNLLARRDQILDQASDEARRRASQGRTGIGAAIDGPNFSAEGDAVILSDTRGYDFGSYLNQVVNRVRVNWYALIPEIARLGAKGRVMILFTINQRGGVQDLQVVANSGLDPLDRAAHGAITASNPFQKLPAGFDGDMIRLQFTFLYNMR
jgi:TonB family protein